MKCKYSDKGCKAPIPINCGDYCVIRNLRKKLEELEEEYTALQQTYEACYKEHLKVVEQNKQLQAEVKDLEDLAECKEQIIRELHTAYNRTKEKLKALEEITKIIS